jgi:hypothetical protein
MEAAIAVKRSVEDIAQPRQNGNEVVSLDSRWTIEDASGVSVVRVRLARWT